MPQTPPLLFLKMPNAASHASGFQVFIFQAHSLSIRMKRRPGLPCFKAKILRISSPRAVCFGVWRPAAWSLYLRELSLTRMNPEPCSLNYVRVSSKCCFRGLSKLPNSCECQTLFLSRDGHCQVCNVHIVFCSLTSKDRRVDGGGLAWGTGEFHF